MTGEQSMRSVIELSWARSKMSGLRRDSAPNPVQEDLGHSTVLDRAARPVLERFAAELDGTEVAVILANHDAHIADLHCTRRSLESTMTALGVAPGVRFGEDNMGTNAIGTPIEVRRGVTVHGDEHFKESFENFSCYGHPIVNPITRRLHGVVDLSVRRGDEHPLFVPLVRRVVRDIEERLQANSPQADQRLAAAFRLASRQKGRAIVALGREVVLATPTALDFLEASDYAALRAYADGITDSTSPNHHLTLTSGRVVRVRCELMENRDSVLIDLVPDETGNNPCMKYEVAGWPLMVVGEVGSGRTTAAREATAPNTVTIDTADMFVGNEKSWANHVIALLRSEGPAVIIENIQLLPEQMTALLARALPATTRKVVLTSTPGDHLSAVHASLTGLCGDRRNLIPLRLRRHEVPMLAQKMLTAATGGRSKLTSATLRVLAVQPWPGNLSELHRVIGGLATVRSAGDITPNDLPASHRGVTASVSPVEQAQRDVIVAAIHAAGGNKVRAAQALEVSRSTLYNRLRALHIDL